MEQSLDLYKIFCTVADTGNISHAAKKLFISQPAISKSIRKLEQQLGTKLFLRTSKGVMLTEEGNILYHYVSDALEAIGTGEKELKRLGQLNYGRLKIGVSTTLCKYVLLPYLKNFIDTYPHIQITITCQSTLHTLKLLEEGTIDIGLIGRSSTLKGVNFKVIGQIEDIFVAAPNYMNNLGIRTGLTSMTNEEFLNQSTLILLDSQNLTRQYIDTHMYENNIFPKQILEASNMDLLIDFAKTGLGTACVIKNFVDEDLQKGALISIPLKTPIPKRDIGFVYNDIHSKSFALKEFLKYWDTDVLYKKSSSPDRY